MGVRGDESKANPIIGDDLGDNMYRLRDFPPLKFLILLEKSTLFSVPLGKEEITE
jgi:hypothetical protein